MEFYEVDDLGGQLDNCMANDRMFDGALPVGRLRQSGVRARGESEGIF